MRRLFFLLSFMSSVCFGSTTLVIEHPRHPSMMTDTYQIVCDKECVVEVIKEKTSKTKIAKSKISKEFDGLVEAGLKGDIPQPTSVSSLRLLYTVKVKNEKSSKEFKLAYPKSYVGTDFAKYTDIISMIEDLRRTIKVEEAVKQ